MRINIAHLESKIDRLNKLSGFKGRKYLGKTKGYAGSGYALSQAYGGVKVVFMTENGGERTVQQGYDTKKDCNIYLSGMIEALHNYKDRDKMKKA